MNKKIIVLLAFIVITSTGLMFYALNYLSEGKGDLEISDCTGRSCSLNEIIDGKEEKNE